MHLYNKLKVVEFATFSLYLLLKFDESNPSTSSQTLILLFGRIQIQFLDRTIFNKF